MPKRRTVLLGMGTLAVGSGATISLGAFGGDTTTPTGNFQILADALTIRRRSDSDPNVNFASGVGDLTGFGDYDRENLPVMEIVDGTNDALHVQIAAETNEEYTFTEPLEIANDTADSYDVQINYAQEENISSEHENWGYGEDVHDENEAGTTEHTDGVSYETVNGIFVFQNNPAGDVGGSDQISPLGDAVEGSAITIGPGEVAALDVVVDTTGDVVGKINAAATGTADPDPWDGAATFVDLMDEVHVEANVSE